MNVVASQFHELLGIEPGCFRVLTSHAAFAFNLSSGSVARVRAHDEPVSTKGGTRSLRRIEQCQVGEPGQWTAFDDRARTNWFTVHTSPVTKITQVPADDVFALQSLSASDVLEWERRFGAAWSGVRISIVLRTAPEKIADLAAGWELIGLPVRDAPFLYPTAQLFRGAPYSGLAVVLRALNEVSTDPWLWLDVLTRPVVQWGGRNGFDLLADGDTASVINVVTQATVAALQDPTHHCGLWEIRS